jgi:hypothetical protein
MRQRLDWGGEGFIADCGPAVASLWRGKLRIADWDEGREKAQEAQEGKFRFVHLVLFCG